MMLSEFMSPTKEMGGGSELKIRVYDRLSLKEKEKDGTTIVSQPYQLKTAKSRLSKENKDVAIRLYYDEPWS